MSKVFRIIFAIVAAVFLMVVTLNGLSNPGQVKGAASDKTLQNKLNKVSPGSQVISANGVQKVITDINKVPLEDNPDIYQFDDPGSVVTMYVTVRVGNEADDTKHTWREINDSTKNFFEHNVQVTVPKAEAILQIGDENGPLPGEVGYGAQVSNATIQIRGNTTSMMPQKSYKIELFKNAGEWRGQQTIALNKHIWDITRAKNKLSFDLMKGLPDMVSLRTQFVHLYVKDETTSSPSKVFQDYGLFTQIEQPNKTFLRSHLLDRYGQLYKAVMFEFYRYPDKIRLADDPLYSEKDFSTVLEIKGNKDHTKLIQVLDDVNNWSIPIQKTFENYFDADNYFTWMAFNILTDNTDTDAQNFYLYSPQNGQKFYFLPWDYDAAFYRNDQYQFPLSLYQNGVASYWGDILHRRVLMIPEYRKKLDDKITEIMNYMTPERINSMMEVYRPITEKYVSQMPDLQYLPGTLDQFDTAFGKVPDDPQLNYEVYRESLKTPMPYYLNTPAAQEDTIRFSWDEAYDFDAQDITYNFQVSTSWDFKTTLVDKKLTNINYIEIPKLATGTYFWRVTATNENNKTQYAFDQYFDSNGYPHYGIKYLYVASDGQLLEKGDQ